MLKGILKFCIYLIKANLDPPHLVPPQNFILSKLLSGSFVRFPLPQYLRRRFLRKQIGGGKDLQSWFHLQISVRVRWGLGENEFRLCCKCGLGVWVSGACEG